MRTYEALYIVQPELDEEANQTVVDGVAKLITDEGGTIVRSEIWGKRRLAYVIKDHHEGVYVLVRFEAEPAFLKKFEAQFKLNEQIFRHLVTHFDIKTLRLEEEQVKRTAALLESRTGADGRRRDHGDDDDDVPRRPRAPRVESKEESTEKPKEESTEKPKEEREPVEQTPTEQTTEA